MKHLGVAPTSAMAGSLSQQIKIAKAPGDRKKILDDLSGFGSSSTELFQKYEGITPLQQALRRSFHDIAFAIMDKMSEVQLLENVKGENPEDTADYLSLLLDLKNVPLKFTPLITDFAKRKILCLLTGMIGKSNFRGVTCSILGHHNYKYVSKILFEMLKNNLASIIERLAKELKEDKEVSEIIARAIESAINLMQSLQSSTRESRNWKIYPALVGTIAGGKKPSGNKDKEKSEIEFQDKEETFLHAEGFVLYRDKEQNNFLLVERANRNKSGIVIYKIDENFDRDKFGIFLAKVQKSAEAGTALDAALDYEEYVMETTGSGFFKELEERYIPMSPQELTNCTTASSEGIFLATLYCFFLDSGIKYERASALSRRYTTLIFEQNRQIEIENLEKEAFSVQNEDLLAFIWELESYKPLEKVKQKGREQDSGLGMGLQLASQNKPAEIIDRELADPALIGNLIGTMDGEGRSYFKVEEPPANSLPPRTQAPTLERGKEISGKLNAEPAERKSPILQLSLTIENEQSASASTPLLSSKSSGQILKSKEKKGWCDWLYNQFCSRCLKCCNHCLPDRTLVSPPI